MNLINSNLVNRNAKTLIANVKRHKPVICIEFTCSRYRGSDDVTLAPVITERFGLNKKKNKVQVSLLLVTYTIIQGIITSEM